MKTTKAKQESNVQKIHKELWNVVNAVKAKELGPGEANAITKAIGVMVNEAIVEVRSAQLWIENPLNSIERRPKRHKLKP